MEDLQYIKNFSKISVSKICEENNINRQNLLNNISTKKNAKIVKNEIEKEILGLYLNDKLENELLKQKNDLEKKLKNETDKQKIENIKFCLKIITDILGSVYNGK